MKKSKVLIATEKERKYATLLDERKQLANELDDLTMELAVLDSEIRDLERE